MNLEYTNYAPHPDNILNIQVVGYSEKDGRHELYEEEVERDVFLRTIYCAYTAEEAEGFDSLTLELSLFDSQGEFYSWLTSGVFEFSIDLFNHFR